MQINSENSSGFLKKHGFLLTQLLVLGSLGLFVYSVILILEGKKLAHGVLYECDEQTFSNLQPLTEFDMQRKIRKDCLRLASCDVKQVTEHEVWQWLCDQLCQKVFLAMMSNETDRRLIRTCDANEKTGSGVFLAVFTGGVLSVELIAFFFFRHKLIKGFAEMGGSLIKAFAEMRGSCATFFRRAAPDNDLPPPPEDPMSRYGSV